MEKAVNIIIPDNQNNILILKRSSNDKSYPNFWDLPGGRVNGNETLKETAEREAKEESNLNIKLDNDYFYIHRCPDKKINIYAFQTEPVAGKVITSREHTEFRWIGKNEWKNLNYMPSVKTTIKEFFRKKGDTINSEPFEKRFEGKLKEVFLYITNRCNLRCRHCYLGDVNNFFDMDINAAKTLLEKTVRLGATKLTILGGEPTLHPFLPKIIKITKDLGFAYVRLDTNGEFSPNLLNNPDLQKLSDICFSLDGADAKTHAKIRTEKNYYSVTKNIAMAISKRYKVRVTMTVNSFNLHQIGQLAEKLEKMGVSALNIHLISKNGRAKNNKLLLLKEKDWMDCYKKTLPTLSKYQIKIKIPQRYIKKAKLNNNCEPTCESAKSSRILVAPDFKIYSCPLLLDSDRYFAYFKNGHFYYTKNYKRNIFEYSDIKGPFCPILMKKSFNTYRKENIIPLCVSYKQTNG